MSEPKVAAADMVREVMDEIVEYIIDAGEIPTDWSEYHSCSLIKWCRESGIDSFVLFAKWEEVIKAINADKEADALYEMAYYLEDLGDDRAETIKQALLGVGRDVVAAVLETM